MPPWVGRSLGVRVHSPPPLIGRPGVNELWLPWLVRGVGADAVHTLAYGAPLTLTVPWIATVHDVVPWDRPETLGRAGRWYLGPSLRYTLARKQPSAVIALADSTARALRHRLGADVPIVTIPNGVSATFTAGPPVPDGPPWRLLSVGTIEPRKGLYTLARAVELLVAGGLDAQARVAGRRGWGGAAPESLTELGYIDDATLLHEYRSAHLLVAPSEAEGFNLPILEAMACGVPVVASDIPVHRDHFQDAALLVPVANPEALADAVSALVGDPSLRARLRARGLE